MAMIGGSTYSTSAGKQLREHFSLVIAKQKRFDADRLDALPNL